VFEGLPEPKIKKSVKEIVYKRSKGHCENEDCPIGDRRTKNCEKMFLKQSEGHFHHNKTKSISPSPKTVDFLCPYCHLNLGHKIKTTTMPYRFVSGSETYTTVKRHPFRKIENPKYKTITRAISFLRDETKKYPKTKEDKQWVELRKKGNKLESQYLNDMTENQISAIFSKNAQETLRSDFRTRPLYDIAGVMITGRRGKELINSGQKIVESYLKCIDEDKVQNASALYDCIGNRMK